MTTDSDVFDAGLLRRDADILIAADDLLMYAVHAFPQFAAMPGVRNIGSATVTPLLHGVVLARWTSGPNADVQPEGYLARRGPYSGVYARCPVVRFKADGEPTWETVDVGTPFWVLLEYYYDGVVAAG